MSPDVRERPPRLQPERRRRGDVVIAVVLAVLLAVVAAVLWGTGDAERTSSRPATEPVPAPPAATSVPGSVTEAWRAPSGATVTPVVAGPAVVTADGSEVVGHDATTGAAHWSYQRDLPLCTAAAGFPDSDSGRGRVLALYQGGSGFCSELTALHPDTGARAAAENPDTRPGARLLASGPSVVATGPDYLEVVRSDLVRTLEYGAVPAPTQPDHQPRPRCAHGSVAIGSDRLGLVERCPEESADRLTVLAPDGEDGFEVPQEEFSVPLPGSGAVLVAVSAERVAVALPGPPRLLLFDLSGQQVDAYDLDVPDAEITAPEGGAAAVESDGTRFTWWTGSRTLALDGRTLTPLWTLPATLGPGVRYLDRLLVPVPGGIAVVDPDRGVPERTIPVDRPAGPVRLATAGGMLLEQRTGELVALRPG